MVETIYYPRNKSIDGQSSNHDDFLWIVEPSQDGSLYGYTPGAPFGMQRLGLTVKQLVEDLSPYAAEDPPVVYTGEKKNTLYEVDIATGKILKVFNAAGSDVIDRGSCRRVPGFDSLDDDECEAVGTVTLGRTEYLVGVQSSATGESICTIKYFEWGPNHRDRDLYNQYSQTKDNRYIYSMHDGMVLALDHADLDERGLQRASKPTYKQKFVSPVARVFDVARPQDSSAPDTPLVILPQPKGPSYSESYDDDSRVFVNCTETGSWYALSETTYPMVTRQAFPALSSKPGWHPHDAFYGDAHQLKEALVGVHALSHSEQLNPDIPLIAGTAGDVSVPTAAAPPSPLPEKALDDIPAAPTPPTYFKDALLFTMLCIIMAAAYQRYSSKLLSAFRDKMPQFAEAPTIDMNTTEATVQQELPEQKVNVEKEAKSVRFEGANADQVAPDVTAVDGTTSIEIDDRAEKPADELTPKKKAHRGRRGGKKLKAALAIKAASADPDELPAGYVDTEEGVKQEVNGDITLKPDVVSTPLSEKPPGVVSIGSLTIHPSKVLGQGSGGTFVFEGEFEGRAVAVKRMLPQFFELASQEVQLLEGAEENQNVIRYYCRREDSNFLYIALELCQASLWDLFRNGRSDDEAREDRQMALGTSIRNDPRAALKQLASGIRYLHKYRIVHRDIKPQNILITYPKRLSDSTYPRLVISDFGLCKTLPDDASTIVGTTGHAGTAGWKAPELISKPKDATMSNSQHSANGTDNSLGNGGTSTGGGVKRAIDIFSLGCVFFYVLTGGQHPFDDEEGWMALRERNIKVGRANYQPLELFGPDTIDLIQWMLSPLPEQRPTASQVLEHPFFWSPAERLEFLSLASDRFDQEPRDGSSALLDGLEKHAEEIIPKAIAGGNYAAAHSTLNARDKAGYATTMVLPIEEPNFMAQLDRKFVDTLGKQRRYHHGKLVDLLRALRNKHHHWDDMPADVKARVGEIPVGYLKYWEQRFPALVVGVWRVVKDMGISGEGRFYKYFDGYHEVHSM